jgi:NitT/TauT family transport system substrate-binding protein
VVDIPALMALDSLKEQGYTVQVVTLASADLINEALIRGDIEVGSASTSFAISAIAKGADLRMIVGRANMTFNLITQSRILTCRDLTGKALSFSSRQAVGYIMYDAYLKQHCAGVAPQIVLTSESQNRVAALTANQVDGAYLELEDWVTLQRRAPGKFHILLDFAKEFPQVQYTALSIRREWAKQNPETVKDYVLALLTAERTVMSVPGALQDGIVKYLSRDSAQAQELAAAYISAGAWDVNGGLTRDNLGTTLEFLASSGLVPQDTKVDNVADLSYLNAVLDKIGRK